MPHTSSVSLRRSLRFLAWLIAGAGIFLASLLGSTQAWAQSIICSGNSSIPISPTLLQLSRTGPVTYEVSLCTTPGADVAVSVLPAQSGKVVVAPAVLTFTTSVSQSVAVSIDPGVGETEAFTVAIHHSVASLDPAYDWGTTNTPDVIASYLVGNVIGRVFVDSNGNLVHDTGETTIAGAVVALAGAASPPDQVTDASGQYRFLGVLPGPYDEALAVPAGYVSALAAARAVNVGIGVNTIVDFPLIVAGGIQGAVFEDTNGNGVHDAGEPGVVGVTVTRSGGGQPDATAVTATGGGYTIPTGTTGSYTVTLTTPAGYNSVSLRDRPVDLDVGGAAQADFIVQQQGVIEGAVFVDRDGDEILGPGESGLAGVSVSLTPGGTATTDADGHFRFTGQGVGEYTLGVTVPGGYALVSLGSRVISLALPGASATAGFAVQQLGVVQGVVFDDSNANGVREFGEAGVPGVRVTLTGGATRTTDSLGFYTFDALAPGLYRAAVTVPAGFTALSLTAYDVNIGATASGYANFALNTPDTIAGRVFVDYNGNRLFDPDDIPLAGVDVYLSTGIGSVELTATTTIANGAYRFARLTPGSYNVSVRNALGDRYALTSPDPVFVVLVDGHSAGANFLALPAGTIAGSGVPGSVATLIPSDAPAGATGTLTTTVNGRGYFLFAGIDPGTYRITFAPPPGYTAVPGFVIVELRPDSAARADFATVLDGAIEGVAFNDINADGVRQRGEPPVAGVTVILRDENLAIIAQTVSTGAGRYSFAAVPPGSYIVQPAPVTGFVIESGVDVSLTPAEPGALADVGLRRIGALTGRVFLYQTSDPADISPLANVVVTLSGPGGTRSAPASISGAYQFPDLAAGNYSVSVPTPAGLFHFSPPTVQVAVGADTLDPVVNFAFARRGSVLFLPQVERNVLPYPDQR